MFTDLLSTQNRVESPFIIVKIGNYTFGDCLKVGNSKILNVKYPNYIDSMQIVKVNGAVNTYTVQLIYAITQFDDPNLLEKIFSSVSNSRIITLSYGDWNAPSYIYHEEEAIITKISSNVDFDRSKISYTISCISTALVLTTSSLTFEKTVSPVKPSSKILELFKDKTTGLDSLFPGMSALSHDGVSAQSFIATNDKPVMLEKKSAISILDYISYLVNCMVSEADGDSVTTRSSRYYWAIYDDIQNGSYFKVTNVTSGAPIKTYYDTYEIDVGYPSDRNYVTSFKLNTDDTWSILYDYSMTSSLPRTTYNIDENGNVISVKSSTVTTSSESLKSTEDNINWWASMTQFPITAQLQIRGLIRPAMLMTYVKINTYFYGHKHISSGLYIVTKQIDSVSGSGYKTTLSLTRVSGDDDNLA